MRTEPSIGGGLEAAANREELQRRTLRVLRMAVVPAQAAVAGVVAVVTLLAGELLGSDTWAGMGGAAFTVGAGFASVPLATWMRRTGRRVGMVGALLMAAVGAGAAGLGGQISQFAIFVVGMFLMGAGQASTLQARYVATDLARPEDQGKAIAAIVWIGALGAVFGPVLTPIEQDVARAVGLRPLVGPFGFAALLFVVAAGVYWFRLRPDPLVVAGGVDPEARHDRPLRRLRASFREIRRSRAATLGIAAMSISQAAMVGVMTMTPPHMRDHGHAELSALVIAVHILGMYGLSPLVGRVVDRIGAIRSVAIGASILGTGTVAAVLGGYVPALVFFGLFLLGLGWNLGLIAGTSLLTSSVPERARVEAQGAADLTLGVLAASAALISGIVKQVWGFHVLADAATVFAILLVVAARLTSASLRTQSVSAANG